MVLSPLSQEIRPGSRQAHFISYSTLSCLFHNWWKWPPFIWKIHSAKLPLGQIKSCIVFYFIYFFNSHFFFRPFPTNIILAEFATDHTSDILTLKKKFHATIILITETIGLYTHDNFFQMYASLQYFFFFNKTGFDLFFRSRSNSAWYKLEPSWTIKPAAPVFNMCKNSPLLLYSQTAYTCSPSGPSPIKSYDQKTFSIGVLQIVSKLLLFFSMQATMEDSWHDLEF